MRFAIYNSDTVVNVVDAMSPTDVFLPVGNYIVPHDTANIGWPVISGVVQAPPVAPPSASQLKDYAAEKRWAVETGGIDVDLAGIGTVKVPTDDRAKLMLLGASTSMAETQTAPFVTSAGAVVLTGSQFSALYAAIVLHITACFVAQNALLEQIASGAITTTLQIDAWAWPAN